MASRIGSRAPMYCTAVGEGHASRGCPRSRRHGDRRRPARDHRPHPHRTRRTAVELARIRTRGYSVDDRENEPGGALRGSPDLRPRQPR
ncbi:hypothetical protein ACU686_04515 [Yinghuangia aomiensis]